MTEKSWQKLLHKWTGYKNRGNAGSDLANKDAGRMPWHFGPMKDVISCEKPRGGAHIRRSADV